jgi:hypothetical protein
VLFALSALCSGIAGCTQTPLPAKVDDAEVRATAIACGLEPGQLKFENGIDGEREWLVGSSKNGMFPSIKSIQCIMNWAKDQRGFRIGFISEPPAPETRK